MKRYLNLIFLILSILAKSNALICYSGVGNEYISSLNCPTDKQFSCSLINADSIIRGCLLTTLCQNSTYCCDSDLCNSHAKRSQNTVSTVTSIQAHGHIKCYTCKNCEKDLNSQSVEECPVGNSCSTVTLPKSILKKCQPQCTNFTNADTKNGIRRVCCDTDLCNKNTSHNTSRQIAYTKKLYKPLECYVCKDCGSSLNSNELTEKCPTVSEYYCSTLKFVQNGVTLTSKGCSQYCSNFNSQIRELKDGESQTTCCQNNLCNSSEIKIYSSASLIFMCFTFAILYF